MTNTIAYFNDTPDLSAQITAVAAIRALQACPTE